MGLSSRSFVGILGVSGMISAGCANGSEKWLTISGLFLRSSL